MTATPALAALDATPTSSVQSVNCVVQSVVDGKAILICDTVPAEARQTRSNPTTGLTVAPDYSRLSPPNQNQDRRELARPQNNAPSSSPVVQPKSSRSSSEWIATGPDHIA